MIQTRIWERYFCKQYFKAFLLFIICFYGLYVLIDYTSRLHAIQHLKLSVGEVIYYYLFIFLLRMDILVPFGMIVATVYTLTTINAHRELIALLASGVSLKRILVPFIAIGLCLTALLYINAGVVMPYAMRQLKVMEEVHHNQELIDDSAASAKSIALEDQSIMLFHTYNGTFAQFFDVYWIRSADDIYRIQELSYNHKDPVGKQVDHLKRNAQGQLTVVESLATRSFPEIHFNQQKLQESLTSPQELSLRQLWKKLPKQQTSLTDREAQIQSLFYRKLTIPWLCLLAIIAPAPFCLVYTRRLSVFLLYTCAIFGLVAFYLMMNAAMVLGETQTIPPVIAIVTPFVLVFGGFLWKYAKI
jgi:lipopolysaccharide export system permease protein